MVIESRRVTLSGVKLPGCNADHSSRVIIVLKFYPFYMPSQRVTVLYLFYFCDKTGEM
jgi:hypothetical protein